ncbi:DNA-directed RNA polymerase III subunit RPC2 [Artemisia annua]|uniref:DNA-directed RNA polymerase n=1 Tax=Artemisia annua TaxID=35608 RepID=A0A2U1PW99_ARTAN|nr:DNA-directed RNA polymerase III subunit RPC2 [Artemisia annua]
MAFLYDNCTLPIMLKNDECIIYQKDEVALVKLVPIMVVFNAMGMETDEKVVQMLGRNPIYADLLRPSIEECSEHRIYTQYEALEFLETKVLRRLSFIGAFGFMTKIRPPYEKSLMKVGDRPRALQPSQWCMLCPCDTREGEGCGSVINLALMAHVTTDEDEGPIATLCRVLGVSAMELLAGEDIQDPSSYMIILNGSIIGKHNSARIALYEGEATETTHIEMNHSRSWVFVLGLFLFLTTISHQEIPIRLTTTYQKHVNGQDKFCGPNRNDLDPKDHVGGKFSSRLGQKGVYGPLFNKKIFLSLNVTYAKT